MDKIICRLCLEVKPKYLSLIENNCSKLIEKIYYCASVNINLNDKIHNICQKCSDKLDEAYDFSMKIKENDRIIQDLCKNNKLDQFCKNKLFLKEEYFEDKYLDKGIEEDSNFKFEQDDIDLNIVKVEMLSEENINYLEENVKDKNIKNKKDKKKKVDFINSPCQICNEELDTIQTLISHYLDEHKIPLNEIDLQAHKLFQCDQCFLVFSNKYWLLDHKKQEHPFLFEHSCDICGQKYAYETVMRRHKVIVHLQQDDEIYETYCKICKKNISSPVELRTHMKRKHCENKTLSCEICGKLFGYMKKLKDHLLRHSDDRRYQCDNCSKKFFSKERLRRHWSVHSGERPFKCPHCDRSYKDKRNLKTHLRTHSTEMPFKCQECGKGFRYNCSLKGHAQQVHGITLPPRNLINE